MDNRGGKSFNDRKLAAEVRTLTLEEIKKVLVGEDIDYKKQIVLTLARTVLPRLNEVTGEDGKDLVMFLPLEAMEKYGIKSSEVVENKQEM